MLRGVPIPCCSHLASNSIWEWWVLDSHRQCHLPCMCHLGLTWKQICACALALRPLFTKFSDPARGAFDPRTVRVSTARFSTYRPPAQRPSESLEKFSDKSLDTPPGPFESTSQIRGGSTTPVTLDEEFGDMRDRASINGILVRTTFRVENS